jgi:hypothetical protein
LKLGRAEDVGRRGPATEKREPEDMGDHNELRQNTDEINKVNETNQINQRNQTDQISTEV